MKIFSMILLVFLLIFAFEAEASPAERLSPPSSSKSLANPSSAATGKCNCRCNLSHNDRFCGVNSKNEKQTFQNECQLDCFNCTHDAAFTRRYSGECKK